ncbi:MAG: signal peptidase I [Candidatus Marinimicrobia bacterium]|nr:signal peptidase I [Candidatus Neomarinimicrobiota bacterium]MDD5230660.1 signal peptidase I [Candidatus Neomarinimicrobiota bacterium]MDD5539257.1 signal peptidase I [Candidatus Neomarinimicrobiota bacterium]
MKEKMEDKKTSDSKFWQEVKSWGIVLLIALGLKATIIEAYQIPTGSMESTILIGDFILGKKFVYGARTPDWIGIPWTKIGFHIPWFRLPSFKKPQPGEVVIFKYPVDPSLNYVKRCIAGPRQTIEIRNKVVYVDGKVFSNPKHSQFISQYTYPTSWNDPEMFPDGIGNKDNYGPVYIPAKGDTLRYGQIQTEIIRNVAELKEHTFRIYQGKMYIDGKTVDYYIAEQDHYFMMGDNRDNSWDSRFWGFVPFDSIMGQGLITYMSWDKERPLYQITKKIRWNRIGRIVA